MKNVSKIILAGIATSFISTSVFADNNSITKQEIQSEIANSIEIAISTIKQPEPQKLAKLHADQMNFTQNVSKFLLIAKYNDETMTIKPQLVSE